jgi:dihydroorotase
VWSRIEENNATWRVIELGKQAGCHIHIAHVSTKEAAAMVREAKADFNLSAEATPHHIACTEDDARRMGEESQGRVNPGLRSEEDRQAIISAICDGVIDAIATDHAPHLRAGKEGGAPGFTGLETAFAVCYTKLVSGGKIGLSRISALMSANPARILGLADGSEGRGRIEAGLRGDLVIVDTEAAWKVNPPDFKSRGKNSPFAGRTLQGKILMTIQQGRIVYVQHG